MIARAALAVAALGLALALAWHLRGVAGPDDPAGRDLAQAFQARPGSLVPGDPVTIEFPDLGVLEVTPVRYEPPLSVQPTGVVFRCGLALARDGQPTQALVTVGVGLTETVSCLALVELGPLALPGRPAHLALVYRLASPSSAYQAGMVAGFDPGSGLWAIDETLSSEPALPPQAQSLEAIRAALTGR